MKRVRKGIEFKVQQISTRATAFDKKTILMQNVCCSFEEKKQWNNVTEILGVQYADELPQL